MINRGGGVRRLFDPAVRIGVAAFVIVVGFAFLFMRLGYIQLGQFGGRLADVSRRVWSSMYVQAQRGKILDRHGRVLAASIEGKSLYAHPSKVKDRHRLALTLDRLGLMTVEDCLARLASPGAFVWLARGIEPDRWARIKDEFVKMDGVGTLPEWRRRYPLGPVGANLIGFVGADGHGLAGVEYMVDPDLAGDVKTLRVEIGEHGLPVIRDADGNENPVYRGEDVTLTVDAYLQEAADQALAETVEQFEARGGSVVVMSARTGEILAMSSYPSFDLNRFSEFPPSQYRNMAVNAVFEPGSTFKLVTLSSISTFAPSVQSDPVFCNGSVHVPGAPKVIRCYANHGALTYRQVVEVSCNVGIVRGGLALPPEDFFRMIQNFGFGIRTGVGLPGEEKGILRKPYRWSKSSQASLSIGHEIAVTNIQIAQACAAVANGGDLLKPHILRRAGASAGPHVVRHVLRKDIADNVRHLLISAVEGEKATGKKAKVPGVRVGGKTGTALVPDPKTGGYDPNRIVSSFVGFFPAEYPKTVISVVIHEPNSSIGHFGGDVAAPAFSKIAAAVLKLHQPDPS